MLQVRLLCAVRTVVLYGRLCNVAAKNPTIVMMVGGFLCSPRSFVRWEKNLHIDSQRIGSAVLVLNCKFSKIESCSPLLAIPEC